MVILRRTFNERTKTQRLLVDLTNFTSRETSSESTNFVPPEEQTVRDLFALICHETFLVSAFLGSFVMFVTMQETVQGQKCSTKHYRHFRMFKLRETKSYNNPTGFVSLECQSKMSYS